MTCRLAADLSCGWFATTALDPLVLGIVALVAPSLALPSSRDLLGPTGPDYQPDADAKARQHVDQCIGAEKVDATAQEIADARLRDAKHLRRFCLLETL